MNSILTNVNASIMGITPTAAIGIGAVLAAGVAGLRINRAIKAQNNGEDAKATTHALIAIFTLLLAASMLALATLSTGIKPT